MSTARRGLVLVLFIFPVIAHAERTWTDVSGKFKVVARFVVLRDGVVVLARTDSGKKIEVPIERLSEDDRKYVGELIRKELNDKRRVLTELEKAASRQPTARHAVAYLTTALMRHPDNAGIAPLLETWKMPEEKDYVRAGRVWLPLSEAEEIEETERRLVTEAFRLFDTNDLAQFVDRLEQASNVNHESIMADSYLGLAYALIARDSHKARFHFTRCVERRRINWPHLTYPAEELNLAVARNNLALANTRVGRYQAAITLFEECAESGLFTNTLIHNLGRTNLVLGSSRYLPISASARRKTSALYSSVAESTGAEVFDDKRGWLYAFPFQEPSFRERIEGMETPPASSSSAAEEDLIPFSKGTAIAVAPGYFLTNHHVIAGADAVKLRDDDGKYVEALVSATLGGNANENDLALLHCPELRPLSVAVAPANPRLGEKVAVIGYPMADRLGFEPKVTQGIVAGLPTESLGGLVAIDAPILAGGSGGPVVNMTGGVTAVATRTWDLTVAPGDHQPHIHGAVPAEKVAGFLHEQGIAFTSSGSDSSVKSLPDLVA